MQHSDETTKLLRPFNIEPPLETREALARRIVGRFSEIGKFAVAYDPSLVVRVEGLNNDPKAIRIHFTGFRPPMEEYGDMDISDDYLQEAVLQKLEGLIKSGKFSLKAREIHGVRLYTVTAEPLALREIVDALETIPVMSEEHLAKATQAKWAAEAKRGRARG